MSLSDLDDFCEVQSYSSVSRSGVDCDMAEASEESAGLRIQCAISESSQSFFTVSSINASRLQDFILA